MTRYLIILVSVLLAASSFAMDDGNFPQGTIARQGIDPGMAYYANATGFIFDNPLLRNLSAPLIRVNAEIPSQKIIINPKSGFAGGLDRTGVEESCRQYLRSSGLVDAKFGLRETSVKMVMDKLWFVSFRKTIDNNPVIDGGIKIAISPAGNISFIMGEFSDAPAEKLAFTVPEQVAAGNATAGIAGNIMASNLQNRVVFPMYFNNRIEYHPAYLINVRADNPYSEWYVYVDGENGEILQRKSSIYYGQVNGNVSGSIQPSTAFDPWEDRDFFQINVNFGAYGAALTDMDGDYSIDIPNNDPLDVETWLLGPYLNVNNTIGSDAYVSDNISPHGNYNVYWDDSNSHPAERCAWYSGVYIHNWIKTLDPDLVQMDFPMGCNVNVNGTCNAFWSGQSMTINFYREGGGCPNIAQIADVVYHEYGHGITDLQYRPYSSNGAMHEGFSDYLACTVTDQPHVGLGFNGPGTYLRNVDNNNRYPDNWSGEPHNDGLIISGALWNTRQILSNYPMGYTDSLWHWARYAHPSNFEEYFWAFLAVDDDDGNINNGTPNAGVIFHTFGDLHGIGPGSVIIITADSLYDTEDTLNSYEVSAEISSPFSPLPDSVLLYYNAGSGWIPVNMTMISGIWTGDIPPQSNGTYVNYYISAVDEGGFRGTAPLNAPDEYYTFYVGPDVIPPTITFIEGPPNTVNLFGPYGPFTISAWDVNGIDPDGVYLHYSVNDSAEDEAVMSPSGGNGEFGLGSLDLGYRLNSGDTVHYYFTALDEAGNPNTGRYPTVGSLDLLMSQEEVFEGFEENGIGEWNVEGAWALFAQGHNGGHCLIFGPNYPDNADDLAYMNYGYDLSPYGGASVTLFHKNVIADGDTCFVMISNDGGAGWTTVGSITGYSGSAFIYDEFDITEALSIFRHDYRVGFRFVSDAQDHSIGVMIDDIGWAVGAMTGVEDSGPALPDRLTLNQNYPNPFNPQTTIGFGLPGKSRVSLEIYDLLGRKIARVIDGELNAGPHTIIWNGNDSDGEAVSSGIYFYRLTTDFGVKQEKMTLLK